MLNLNVERSAIIYRGVVGSQPIRDRCLVPLGVTGSERELKFSNVGAKNSISSNRAEMVISALCFLGGCMAMQIDGGTTIMAIVKRTK